MGGEPGDPGRSRGDPLARRRVEPGAGAARPAGISRPGGGRHRGDRNPRSRGPLVVRSGTAASAVAGTEAHPGGRAAAQHHPGTLRSEEHTSELQSLMRISYDVVCLKKNKKIITDIQS